MKLKTMDEIYREEIVNRLKLFKGRKKSVAASLGISYATLYTKMRKHGLTYLIKDVNSPVRRRRPFEHAMRSIEPEPIPILPTGVQPKAQEAKMKTRAKFQCHGVKEDDQSFHWSFGVVYHGDDKNHENFKFSEFTPSGDLNLTVDKSKYKGEHPTPGKEYYLDITECE